MLRDGGAADVSRLAAPVVVIFFMWGFGTGALWVARPLFVDSLGGSLFQIGLVSTFSALPRLVSGPVTGLLSDRWGRRPMLILGALAHGAILVAQFFSDSYVQFALLELLAGVGIAFWTVSSGILIADLTKIANRGRGVGLRDTAMRLGMLAGPLVGGLIAAQFELRWVFIFIASTKIPAIFVVLFIIPETRPQGERPAPPEAPLPISPLPRRGPLHNLPSFRRRPESRGAQAPDPPLPIRGEDIVHDRHPGAQAPDPPLPIRGEDVVHDRHPGAQAPDPPLPIRGEDIVHDRHPGAQAPDPPLPIRGEDAANAAGEGTGDGSRQQKPPGMDKRAGSPGAALGMPWEMFRSKAFGALAFAAFSFGMIGLGPGVFRTYYPIHAQDTLLLSPDVIGNLVAAGGVLTMLSAMPTGMAVDRFGRRGPLAAGLLLLGVAVYLLGASEAFVGVAVAVFVFAAAEGMNTNTLQTYAMDLAPAERRGAFLSAFHVAMNLGMMAGPLAAGLLAGWVGLQTALIFFAGVMAFAAALFALAARETLRRERPA